MGASQVQIVMSPKSYEWTLDNCAYVTWAIMSTHPLLCLIIKKNDGMAIS